MKPWIKMTCLCLLLLAGGCRMLNPDLDETEGDWPPADDPRETSKLDQ